MTIFRLIFPTAIFAIIFVISITAQDEKNSPKKEKSKKSGEKPLRALLITGGCCHDYDMQKKLITAGISERAGRKIEWSVVYEQFSGKDHKIGIYSRKDWAKDFDVVVHNECYGGVTDNEFVNLLVKGHTDHGVGVVMIHCSMHSYRAAETDEYRKLIGISSYNHGKKSPIKVTKLAVKHPVTDPLPVDWTTVNGELYNSAKVWDTATPLAEGTIPTTEGPQVCIWVNEYKGCKTFGTTIGHHNETMLDPIYMDLLTRGFLWSAGKLKSE